MGIGDPVEHVKFELFSKFNGQMLKFSTGFSIHLWKFEQILLWLLDFDLAGLPVDFLPVSWAHLFKYLKNSFKKKKNETIRCLRLKEHILEI